MEEAWNDEDTIVTANGGDFVRYILAHQKVHTHGKLCHDMCGLIVIPNKELRAQNAVAQMKKRGLRVQGKVVAFDVISTLNLYVNLHAGGSATIKRFPLCPYREDTPDLPDWYHTLPTVGASDTN